MRSNSVTPIPTSYGCANVTEAVTDSTDLLETLAFQQIGEVDQSSGNRTGLGDGSKEFLKIFFVLFAARWKLPDIERIPLPKEIGYEDSSAQCLGQDISSLQGLGEVARLAG